MFLSLVVAAAAAITVAQQHPHPSAAASEAVLLPGMGRHHHPIATSNPEAQQFFDQGLTLVFGFNHDEAIRSFRRAADLDPKSPMPQWGIALALGPNINLDVDPDREKAAFEAARRAQTLASNGSAAERAYVQAIARRYSDDPGADLKALAVAYKNAMRDLAAQYPDDLDAATLYAESLMNLHPWQLWAADGTPAEGTEEIVAVLEGVLRRDPMHVGANHYYIHAVEASPRPDRALPSAGRLETLVPNAGHLVHMPAHIYMRTGNYAGAVERNEVAARIDRAYIEAHKVEGVYLPMYYGHNLDFLASAAMMTGQFATASRAADELVSLVTPMLEAMPMVEPSAAKKMYVLLRFGRWDDVLALPAPPANRPILALVSNFGRGVAHAALGHPDEAEQDRVRYRDSRRALGTDLAWGYNKAPAIVAITDAVLDARIAAARGDQATSIDAWAAAVAATDRLSYNEPADWFYPVRESLGAALFGAGRHGEAEAVFREDLVKHPGNPRSLFGLWQVLAAQGRDAEAVRAEADYKAASSHADTPLRIEMF